MKANDFVRKFGWLRAKQIIKYSDENHRYFIADGISTTYSKYGDVFYSLGDLKRLVESHEVVEERGGLAKAKERVSREEVLPNPNVFYVLVVSSAITDVESCL